jgi:arginine decarboxylase-like protein
MREASQLYTELVRVGAAMGILDVGGGLGVDYDGSQGGELSVNYTMQNYANDVVAIMNDACLQKGVRTVLPQPYCPTLRLLAAHHSVRVSFPVSLARETPLCPDHASRRHSREIHFYHLLSTCGAYQPVRVELQSKPQAANHSTGSLGASDERPG